MSYVETRIAGVSFSNDNGESRQDILRSMRRHQHVKLRDMASAEYPEAIGVFNVKGQQLGFLPANVARDIRSRIRDLSDIHGQITSIGSPDGSKNIGCYIRLLHPKLNPNVGTNTQKRTEAHTYPLSKEYEYNQEPKYSYVPKKSSSRSDSVVGVLCIIIVVALIALLIHFFS